MNLSARFTWAIGGLIGLLFLLFSGLLYFSDRRHLREETDRAHQLNADHLALACDEALLSKEDLGLVDFMNNLRRSPDLVEASCASPAGQVMIHTDLTRLNTPADDPSPALGKSVVREGPAVFWDYRSRGKTGTAGAALARVRYDARAVETRLAGLMKKTGRRLTALAAVVLGVGLFLAGVLARGLVRPIQRVAQAARRVGQGQLGTRVPEKAPGELGQLAREFNAMAEKLGQLEAMKDQFIHSVSHDLRNPLSAIATSAKTLMTDDLPDGSRPLVEVIESSAIRLRTMVNNILDTAKMREGRLTFDRSAFSIQPILKEITRLYLPLAKQSEKTLLLQLPPDLPLLWADEEQVLRVFLNLLTNAFKFTNEGATITVSAAPPTGGFVEFSVADTGVGIDPALWARLFEPFAAVDGGEDSAQRRQGTGLGLSIVKTLVEGHGGRVTLRSARGQGTTVLFTLPVKEATP